MISILRNLPADKAGVYQKLLEENKEGSPYRDYIWVEKTISDDPTVPLGTEYMRNLSALQIILRTCLSDRQAYGTLIPAIHPFSTDMLSPESIGIFDLKGHCFKKASNPQFLW
ncbi:hypothetical protein [Aquiflexum sp.]|uniref:hypothetical protein n=1 Tax=Aquiflexum sp. TaxID=1872584 RepID=UPI003593CCC9